MAMGLPPQWWETRLVGDGVEGVGSGVKAAKLAGTRMMAAPTLRSEVM